VLTIISIAIAIAIATATATAAVMSATMREILEEGPPCSARMVDGALRMASVSLPLLWFFSPHTPMAYLQTGRSLSASTHLRFP
jgi:hypothetical protein